ncbi:hypothetical protein CRUP_023056 [Coryphaenoides rupestris]|nr:hypothetical protein CRUP_023056 [Coryphaenoides rupestris]
MRREVEVQLINPPESGCLSSCQQGSVTTATIAATAPLIQAQSQLEFRVSQLTDALRRLQEISRWKEHPSSRTSSQLLEAALVLRDVRRQRKVLEENLEAMLRASDTEALHCHLDAMSANRWKEHPSSRTSSQLLEAALVLRDVRRQRKVLEENLEAMLRASDTEALHSEGPARTQHTQTQHTDPDRPHRPTQTQHIDPDRPHRPVWTKHSDPDPSERPARSQHTDPDRPHRPVRNQQHTQTQHTDPDPPTDPPGPSTPTRTHPTDPPRPSTPTRTEHRDPPGPSTPTRQIPQKPSQRPQGFNKDQLRPGKSQWVVDQCPVQTGPPEQGSRGGRTHKDLCGRATGRERQDLPVLAEDLGEASGSTPQSQAVRKC